MTDEPTVAPPANSAFRVLAAIADLGEATAAAIAEKAGLAYPTVTPKLRAWESTGQAEKYQNKDTAQTLWRLTESGKASTATPAQHAARPADADETPAKATVKPAKRRPTVAEPDPGNPTSDGEPDAAEPVHHDAAVPAPALAPATAATGTDDATPDVDACAAAIRAADPPDAPPTASAADDETVPADGGPAKATGAGMPVKCRRPKGALEASALAILQANPDSEYKVGAMKAAIDEVDADTGYPRASEGAVSNALDKLAHQNKAVRVEGRKAATFQLAATAD
ncbi:hypothetical protein [Actinoplanes awajinensis]|uniref:Uncharacterized protein n=1 Tax=Actinoplanes awajinensis subsp. mycoplanecinus TaxID=135947 RepID=A0A101JQP5_9ACTN|nr:hypothetical protein [Actinoplanes awajinensis]KUL31423.1 hypothetical protein ADL15_22055 [Actinoplanes awajinensis subsp. mycoplanecinus]